MTGLICATILVYPRGSLCKILDTLLLRTTVFHPPVYGSDQNYVTSHGRVAGFVSVRHFLSNLAHLVQLDRLPAYGKLSRNVRLLERDGHCA